MGYSHFSAVSTKTGGYAVGKKGSEVEIIDSSGNVKPGGTQNYTNDLTSSVVVAGAVLAIPVTHRLVTKTTGGVEALTLANGTAGQKLTIYCTAAGGDGTLTPATSLNFGTVVFTAAGDTASFEYVDDTVGWIITGAAGVLAPPVISTV